MEKKARKNGFAIFTYHDDTLITDSPDNEYIKNEALLNNLKIIREDEFSTAIDFAPCKCMLVSDKEKALIGLEQHWEKTPGRYSGCFPFRALLFRGGALRSQ